MLSVKTVEFRLRVGIGARCVRACMSLFLRHSNHKTGRLWTLAQDIILEWEERKKRRFGGGALCESRKTVFCVPCPVASDSCHDQASASLLGDVAETEQSSSVAGVRVLNCFFLKLCLARYVSPPILRDGDVEQHHSELSESSASQLNTCYDTHGHVSVF